MSDEHLTIPDHFTLKPGWVGAEPLAHRMIPAHHRRLSDKILIVFHLACDDTEVAVAQQLFDVLEVLIMTPRKGHWGERRVNMDDLVNAQERLWRLKHPGQD